MNGTKIELYNGLFKFEALGARIDTEDPGFKGVKVEAQINFAPPLSANPTRFLLHDRVDRILILRVGNHQ